MYLSLQQVEIKFVWILYAEQYDDLTVFTKEFTNRINAGDEAFTTIPVIADQRLIANYEAQSKNLARAYNAYNFSDSRWFICRLKNVSLSYDLKI
jgi:UDP-galactopyranose mutase